jgi:hypothetical protein
MIRVESIVSERGLIMWGSYKEGDNDLQIQEDREITLVLAKGQKWSEMINKTALIKGTLIYHHRREIK